MSITRSQSSSTINIEESQPFEESEMFQVIVTVTIK